MARITYRPYAPGDEVAINEGFNRVFGLARTLEEWEWKFPARPHGRWIMLGWGDDGRLLTHYAAVPVRVAVGDRQVLAGQIVDVFSALEARTGLATARAYVGTVDAFIERFCGPDRLAFCFGFPSARPLRLGLMRTHYDQVPPRQVMVWRRSAAARGRWLTRHTVRTGVPAVEALDELWRRAASRLPAAPVRDAEYLLQRYGGRPGADYVWLAAWRGLTLAAVAVLRALPHALAWADLLWDGRDTGAVAALDRAAARVARGAGLAGLELWLAGDPACEAILRSLGWRATPHDPELQRVIHAFDPALDAGFLQEQLSLTLGDSDLV